MPIQVTLAKVVEERGITQQDLASRIGLSYVNLNRLYLDKVESVRFSTLDALCRELECQPGDILEWVD